MDAGNVIDVVPLADNIVNPEVLRLKDLTNPPEDSFRLTAGVAFFGETYSFSDQLFLLSITDKEIVAVVLHSPFAPEVENLS